MYIKLIYKKNIKSCNINISGSKSETNRLLIIKKLYNNIKLYNVSNSNDTSLMIKALKSKKKIIDVEDAGTVMRFLISYFSIQKNRITVLTGTKRMQERPIYHLVKSLQKIGAKIKYIKKKGFPPIKIVGQKIVKNKLEIISNISSQYISSLILIGPKLKNGLIIKLLNEKFSFSYINLTTALLNKIGFNINLQKNYININKYNRPNNKTRYLIESDWSSASYFYSIISVSKIKKIILSRFKRNSYQGDSIIRRIFFKYFGIITIFKKNNFIILKKVSHFSYPKILKLNLKDTPDIAQTIIVTCSILKIKCLLTGLDTLKIKETDRLKAMNKELKKVGTITKINKDSIRIIKFNKVVFKNKIIKTYKDHRMAMSFAPYSIKNRIYIENPYVVNKSYPNFWRDLKKIGFSIKIIK